MKNKHLIAVLTAFTAAIILTQTAAQSISALIVADRMEGCVETAGITDSGGETMYVPVTEPVTDGAGDPVLDENGEPVYEASVAGGWLGALLDTENAAEGGACIRSDPEFEGSFMTSVLPSPLNLAAYGEELTAGILLRVPEEGDRARLLSLTLILKNREGGETQLPLLPYITSGEWTSAAVPLSRAVKKASVAEVVSVTLAWETESAQETLTDGTEPLPKFTLYCDLLRFGTEKDFALGVPLDGASVLPVLNFDGDDAEIVSGYSDALLMAEGTGCLVSEPSSKGGVSLSCRFDAKDLSALSKNGGLYFWLYVSDASLLTHGQLELSSSGKSGAQSSLFALDGLTGLENGWNEILLPLSTISGNGDPCDLSKLNFLCLTAPDAKDGGELRVDGMYAGLLSDFAMDTTYDPVLAGETSALPATKTPETAPPSPPKVFEEPIAPAVTESDFRIFIKENRTAVVLFLVALGMLLPVADAVYKKKTQRENANKPKK